MDEEPLLGGNTHAEVVKAGETVRRPTGHWTPGVHALLRHLESRGFVGAPRVLGVDERGREILTYVPGSVVWPDHFALVEGDASLAEVAALMRCYHDLVADFNGADTFSWSDHGADWTDSSEILCHNDFAPWNLIRGSNGDWTFIDWDLAAPGRRSWDLSWALLSFVPLLPDATLTELETIHRISVFREAYGAALVAGDVLTVAVERCANEGERIGRFGADGVEPYARLLAEGHADIWHRAAAHIADHSPVWEAAFLPERAAPRSRV